MIIEINKLNYIYNPGTPFERHALKDIELQVAEGEFIGLIGHTGSGKSTLVQHLNRLVKPSSGNIKIDGEDINAERVDIKKVRQKVGLVFQYPEYQLFEETVYDDIGFGPKNLGLEEKEVHERIKEAMEIVGLDYEDLKDRSPFELSGGQKRRVALAGVIAMKPRVLILDEPTAGLDPKGRDEILEEIQELYKKENITIILVSHNMEEVARLVDRILVMDEGRIAMDGDTREIFKEVEKLEKLGLGIPQITRFMREYRDKGNDVKTDILTVKEAKEELIRYLRSKRDA